MLYTILNLITTYRYRLKGKNIGKLLSAQSRSVNIVWNFCVETQKEIQKRHRFGQVSNWMSAFDFSYLMKGCSQELGLQSQTLNEVARYFTKSRDTHKKCPKFRKAGDTSNRSLGWIPFTKQNRQIVGVDSVKYLGKTYRFFGANSRPLPSDVRGGCFAEDSKGQWYVSFHVDVREDDNHGDKEIGVDLGLKDLVTTSDGDKYENPKYYYKLEESLKKAQRFRDYKKVKKINAKIKNQRKDYLHKLSNKLVRESSLIIVGNVKADNMRSKGLRRSARDASWSGLREMLRYKASRHGVKYLETNEAFTTQTCSHCGQRPEGRPKGIAGLGIREWTCSLCGETHDRDVNAAKNILNLGRGAPPPDGGSLCEKSKIKHKKSSFSLKQRNSTC